MTRLSVVFISLFSLISISLVAGFQSEKILHTLRKDGIVREGNMKIYYSDVDVDNVKVHIDYRFVYRILFSNKVKQGVEVETIPRKYTTLDGFLDLEREGEFRNKDVIMSHFGRIDYTAKNGRTYYDCHKVKLIPVRTDKKMTWDALFTYCPEVPSVGWAHVALTIKRIPFLGSKTVYSDYQGVIAKK
ncbi:MAG: hypothetical protein GY909_00365 [Oligoflexia bacterium]|nr:hypothetical protein [Oligoflexia bacterium]